MAATITQEKKKQKYLLLTLGAIVLGTLLVVWLGFSKKETAVPQPSSGEKAVSVAPIIEIDLDFIRKPLVVDLPYLSAELTANPSLAVIGQKIDLIVNISGLVDSTPFTYKFDCNNDGKYEKVAENIIDMTYTAAKVCDYQEKGDYTAQALIEGKLKYFAGGSEEITRLELKNAFASIAIKDPNSDPIISSCDVDPSSGSTLAGSEFHFNVSANDPDNDKLIYSWDFNDGAYEDISNPAHQYKAPGNYFPFVRVFDAAQDGRKRGGEASCYPASLLVSKDLMIFEEFSPFEGEFGRENPFVPY